MDNHAEQNSQLSINDYLEKIREIRHSLKNQYLKTGPIDKDKYIKQSELIKNLTTWNWVLSALIVVLLFTIGILLYVISNK